MDKKFDYGQFKPQQKTAAPNPKQVADSLRQKYGPNINAAEINKSKNRSKTYIRIAIILLLLVWFTIGLLYIINENRFFNAQTFASGDSPVIWLIEDKELQKFSTTVDIAPGVIYHLKMSVKNDFNYGVSLRIRVDFTYQNGKILSGTSIMGLSNKFVYRNGWYYYKSGDSTLLSAKTEVDFAAGFNIGINNPQLNYYTVNLKLYAESYEAVYNWD